MGVATYVANFQMAGSNIRVPGCEQLTRSVWPNGMIKLAVGMLESGSLQL